MILLCNMGFKLKKNQSKFVSFYKKSLCLEFFENWLSNSNSFVRNVPLRKVYQIVEISDQVSFSLIGRSTDQSKQPSKNVYEIYNNTSVIVDSERRTVLVRYRHLYILAKNRFSVLFNLSLTYLSSLAIQYPEYLGRRGCNCKFTVVDRKDCILHIVIEVRLP